jgi:Conserved hypothetical protein 2217 (DUF2460)
MSNAIYPTVKGLTWTVLKTPKFNSIVQSAANKTEVRIAQTQNPTYTWELIYEWLYDYFNSPNNTMPYSPQTDFRTMLGFFLARKGMFDDFLFDDPSDDWVGPQTWKARYDFKPGTIIIDPAGHGQLWSGGGTGLTLPTFNDSGGSVGDGSGSWADQGVFTGSTAQTLQLVTDGTFYYSPLQRYMGALFYEDVTDLNTSVNPLRIWANGVLKTGSGTDYTLMGPGLSIPGYSFMGMYVKWVSMPTAPITAAFNFYFRVRFLSDDIDFEQFMQQLWTIGGGSGKNGRGMLELTTSRPSAV